YAHVETVRTIEHNSGNQADVSIGMDDAPGNQYGLRIVLTHHHRDDIIKSLRFRAVVPQSQLEVRWANKTKQVRLVYMFMRPASHTWARRGGVGHHREELGVKFIMAKELGQPPTRVRKPAQISYYHAVDFTSFEGLRHLH